MKSCGIENFKLISSFKGSEQFKGTICHHPFKNLGHMMFQCMMQDL